jgi:hypothetical protein
MIIMCAVDWQLIFFFPLNLTPRKWDQTIIMSTAHLPWMLADIFRGRPNTTWNHTSLGRIFHKVPCPTSADLVEKGTRDRTSRPCYRTVSTSSVVAPYITSPTFHLPFCLFSTFHTHAHLYLTLLTTTFQRHTSSAINILTGEHDRVIDRSDVDYYVPWSTRLSSTTCWVSSPMHRRRISKRATGKPTKESPAIQVGTVSEACVDHGSCHCFPLVSYQLDLTAKADHIHSIGKQP